MATIGSRNVGICEFLDRSWLQIILFTGLRYRLFLFFLIRDSSVNEHKAMVFDRQLRWVGHILHLTERQS